MSQSPIFKNDKPCFTCVTKSCKERGQAVVICAGDYEFGTPVKKAEKEKRFDAA